MIRKEIQKIIDNIYKFEIIDKNLSFGIDLEFINDSENKERLLIKFENLGLFDRRIKILFWKEKEFSYYPRESLKIIKPLREEKRILFKVISKILKQFNKEKKEREILLESECLNIFRFEKKK